MEGVGTFFLKKGSHNREMIYLKSFRLPTRRQEDAFYDWKYAELTGEKYGGGRDQWNDGAGQYPFRLFYEKTMPTFEFEPVTILYGGNGSGKTTILNLIADRLEVRRMSPYNRSDFFGDFVGLCEHEGNIIPKESRIITSDDVFNYLLDIRCLNDGVVNRRHELFDEYVEEKARSNRGETFYMRSLADYEGLKKRLEVQHSTYAQYTRRRNPEEIRERSNGESAYRYFTEAVAENALYLLDEPENSLSPALQLELIQFLTESARFFGCQLIIATHSPFLLSMKGAKIYDLDDSVPTAKHWTELENVRIYQKFFKEHENEFR